MTCSADGWCGSLGDYAAIWGSSLSDIWVAANHVKQDPAPGAVAAPALLHWNGSGWTTSELADAALVTLTSLWGTSSSDVWVIGTPAYAAHYDGNSWSRSFIPTGSPLELASISGTGPADVWLGGFGLFHFDGQAWTPRVTDLQFPITSVSATPGELWSVSGGFPRRSQDFGESWSPAAPAWNPSLPPPSHIWRAVWSDRAGAAFLAGKAGALARWSGAEWQITSLGDADKPLDFNALAGLSTADVWAVGDWGALAHWDGRGWARKAIPTSEHLHGVWGASNVYFAVGDHGTFLKLDARDWVGSRATAHEVNAIWGGAANDVWAVGKDSIHWDGTSWTSVDELSGLDLRGVWGSGPGDVWAAGSAGVLRHFDGSQWARAQSPTSADITGVWGSGPSDIWAVDAIGQFLRFDGQRWALWPAEDFGPLAAVHGNGPTDVVAVGRNGRVHFDGGAWTRLPSHPSESPTYFTAFGDGQHVYLGGMVSFSGYKGGGANPELARWDGKSVVDDLEPSGSGTAVIRAGWAGNPTDVWIGLPKLMHWDGRAWTSAASVAAAATALGATTDSLWAATPTGHMVRKRLE